MLFNVLINSKKKCVNKINTFKINYSGGSSSISTLPNIINELRDFTEDNMNTNIKDFNEKIYIRIFDNVDEPYIVKDNYNLHIPENYIEETDLLNDIKSKIGDIHIIFVKDSQENPLTENEEANVLLNFNNMNFGSVLIYRNKVFFKNYLNINKEIEDYIITEIKKINNKINLGIAEEYVTTYYESKPETIVNKIQNIISNVEIKLSNKSSSEEAKSSNKNSGEETESSNKLSAFYDNFYVPIDDKDFDDEEDERPEDFA